MYLLDVAFTFVTVHNRPQPSAKKGLLLDVSNVSLLRFAW